MGAGRSAGSGSGSRRWPVLRRYEGEQLRCVAMPLGGIGTGTVSLGGRGDLRDWEIGNRPAKGFVPRHSFFALRARRQGHAPVTRVLEGPPLPPYDGWSGARVPNAGLPRFRSARFDSAYPLASVHLADPAVPVRVRLEAFNPFLPGDADASGIPVAMLRWVVRNPSRDTVDVAIAGSVQNVVGALRNPGDGILVLNAIDLGQKCRNVNEVRSVPRSRRGTPPVSGLLLRSEGVDPGAEMWGTIAIAALESPRSVTSRTAWADVSWGDTLADYWDDFAADGRLDERDRGGVDKPIASLAVSHRLAPGEERAFTFLLAWHFPNRMTWTPGSGMPWVLDEGPGTLDRPPGEENPDRVGNHYATRYADAWDVVVRTSRDLPALEDATVDFVSAFCATDLPVAVKDAALCNLTALRSQTSFRIESGELCGWEGTGDDFGCCPGSCTHVWNYESATSFLFGDLSRSMRELELLHATRDDGHMSFRIHLPIARATEWGIAAADGQMGCIVRLYRDWRLCGDDEWLRRLWPRARAALAFAWTPGGWDADRDGVMEGCQHNTMDCEYFGPNPQMGLWYLAALRSCEEMARHLGDDAFAGECHALFERGSAWIDSHLFNGEYYEHEIRPHGDRAFIAPGLEAHMFGEGQDYARPRGQLGPGCLVDQAVGQVLAHTCGLGHLVDRRNLRTTLRSIVRHNHRRDFFDHVNDKRAYVMGDESGLLMASYPRGEIERPFTYAHEVMTGFEYTAAVGMLYEGLVADGLRCIETTRSRYDGSRRNPFDEAECGHHYARAMASWGAVLALTGFDWSAVAGRMAFRAVTDPVRWWWSNGSAWGTVRLRPTGGGATRVALHVARGSIDLASFTLTNRAGSAAGAATFDPPRTITTGESVRFTTRR